MSLFFWISAFLVTVLVGWHHWHIHVLDHRADAARDAQPVDKTGDLPNEYSSGHDAEKPSRR